MLYYYNKKDLADFHRKLYLLQQLGLQIEPGYSGGLWLQRYLVDNLSQTAASLEEQSLEVIYRNTWGQKV